MKFSSPFFKMSFYHFSWDWLSSYTRGMGNKTILEVNWTLDILRLSLGSCLLIKDVYSLQHSAASTFRCLLMGANLGLIYARAK